MDNLKWIKAIREYVPYNDQEKKDQYTIIKCIKEFEDVWTRSNELAHLTSSAWVMNDTKDKVLMVYHNIYDNWSWTGGHADGEKDLLKVAIKEVKEETGVRNVFPINADIFSLDILPVLGHIKKGKYVSAHLHLSVTFLLKADETEKLLVKEDENSDVKWIPIDEIKDCTNEPHMKRVYEKLINKTKSM